MSISLNDTYINVLNNDSNISNLILNTSNLLQTNINTKQAIITGGATTITTTNLTANRALLSDTSGKVAVSGVTNTELGYLSGVTSAIQTQLNSKQATITGGATTITTTNLTVNRALLSDASGKVAVSGVTNTELEYVSGVTSAIQTQLNNDQATLTGGATSIATANLTANRALLSDASGKVAISGVTNTEMGYLSGVTSAIQTQLNSKQATITGAATSIATTNLTTNRALLSDASGKVAVSGVTNNELGYISGVTSSIQTELNSKASSSHTHSIDNITDGIRFFNNMGNNYSTTTDFNLTPDFGFRFVQGNTNGPGTNGAGQYYVINQGLGNDYSWSSYGMQIAIPRNVGLPYISIRYKEGNAFGGWNQISAGQADKLTTARNINGVSFNGTTDISINSFGNTYMSNIYLNDNGIIQCADGNHQIKFRRTEDILELWEYGMIFLSPGTTEKMRITRDGNVGIGKAPSYKLDVAGDINCSGSIRVNGVALSLAPTSYTYTYTTTGTYIYIYLISGTNGLNAFYLGSDIRLLLKGSYWMMTISISTGYSRLLFYSNDFSHVVGVGSNNGPNSLGTIIPNLSLTTSQGSGNFVFTNNTTSINTCTINITKIM